MATQYCSSYMIQTEREISVQDQRLREGAGFNEVSVQDQGLRKVAVLYLDLWSVSVHDQSSRISPRPKMT